MSLSSVFNKSALWVFCLLIFNIGLARAGDADSLKTHKKVSLRRFVFSFDSRYSWISKQYVQIGGFKLGIEWKQRYRVGIGLYNLSTELDKVIAPSRDNPNDTVNAKFRFGYMALYGEYVLLHTKRWELSVPVQLGYGSFNYEFEDLHGKPKQTKEKPITLIEPSLAAHYKVFNWIGLGAGVGYRQMLTSSNRIEHQLDAPIYYVKVKIFLGDLYDDIFHRDRVAR